MHSFIHFDPARISVLRACGRTATLCCVWMCVRVCECVRVLCMFVCVRVCSYCLRGCTSTCIQLPLAIFSDWAWPDSLLPCFLLCIPNYGGEFLGRTTRIARFGLISSLNRDISRLQPSVLPPTPSRVPRATLLRSDPSTSERMRFIPIFIFHVQVFQLQRETIKKYVLVTFLVSINNNCIKYLNTHI